MGFEIAKPSSEILYLNYVIYIFFCATIGLLMFFHYRNLKQSNNPVSNRIAGLISRKIDLPPPVPEESKYLYERVKFYFESYNQGLELQFDQDFKLLYGLLKRGFHRDVFMICLRPEVKPNLILEGEIKRTLNHMDDLLESLFPELESETFRTNRYFISEKSHFCDHRQKIYTFSESQLLLHLVDFKPYLEELVYKYETDKLPFSNPEIVGRKFTLSETFIIPTFNGGEEELQEKLELWLKEDSQRHMALLGDYGTGKTSFLKYFVHDLAKRILSGEEGLRIPIFIPLTGTSPIHGGIYSKISDFLARNRIIASPELFDRLIYKGQLLFVLDGFDEMGFIGSEEQRFEQLNAIWRIATKGNKILISGRPSYFPNEFEQKEALNILSKSQQQVPQERPYCEKVIIDFFSNEQILSSIKSYFPDPGDFNKYFGFIVQNKSVLDLCRRPSMMHIVREMMPIIFTEYRYKSITSSALINKYVGHWIERQLTKTIISAVKNERIKKQFIIDFFVDLAGNHYDSSKGSFTLPRGEVKKLLYQKFESLHLSNDDHIQGFENEIFTGYFLERFESSFRFVHKSFYEFFVAKKIVSELKDGKYNSKLILDQQWSDEIVSFVLELADEESSTKTQGEANLPKLLLLGNSFIKASSLYKTLRVVAGSFIILLRAVLVLLLVAAYSGASTLLHSLVHQQSQGGAQRVLLGIGVMMTGIFAVASLAIFVQIIIKALTKKDFQKASSEYDVQPGVILIALAIFITTPIAFENTGYFFKISTLIALAVAAILFGSYLIIRLLTRRSLRLKFVSKAFLVQSTSANFPVDDEFAAEFDFINHFYYRPQIRRIDEVYFGNITHRLKRRTSFEGAKFTKLGRTRFEECSFYNCSIFFTSTPDRLTFTDCKLIDVQFILEPGFVQDSHRFIDIFNSEANIGTLSSIKELINNNGLEFNDVIRLDDELITAYKTLL
ncbi:MAG: NACHT domain-containing protein [Cyanothece sp. SIO1E1]|nr:NACHT domain-containing protein [Cyanothece sp. SIO1E1]